VVNGDVRDLKISPVEGEWGEVSSRFLWCSPCAGSCCCLTTTLLVIYGYDGRSHSPAKRRTVTSGEGMG